MDASGIIQNIGGALFAAVLAPKSAVFGLQLRPRRGLRPELGGRAFAHGGGQVPEYVPVGPFPAANELLYLLALGFAVEGAGTGEGSEAVQAAGGAQLAFAEINERPDDGEAGAVEMGAGKKGFELAGIQEAQDEGFDGVVVVMGVGDFVEAVLDGKTVDDSPPEIGAYEAGVLAAAFGDGAGDVGLQGVVGHAEAGAEFRQRGRVEVAGELKVEGYGGQFERPGGAVADGGEGIGEKNAVLASASLNILFIYDCLAALLQEMIMVNTYDN